MRRRLNDELQPHKRSSETRRTLSVSSGCFSFNRTSVRLKLAKFILATSFDYKLQPHKRSSETIHVLQT